MKSIFLDWGFEDVYSFHAKWCLDGWNDDVIQPARDAVLNYYKVRVSIYPSALLVLNPSNRILVIL